MNDRHVKIILDGLHQSILCPCNDSVKVVGENGEAAYMNGCVLVIIAPWLSKPLSGRITTLRMMHNITIKQKTRNYKLLKERRIQNQEDYNKSFIVQHARVSFQIWQD